MKQTLTITLLLTACALTAQAQRSSSSMNLMPQAKADVTIPFDIKAEGKRYDPTWGLDQAWPNKQNIRKGIVHMGRENIGIARSAFSYTKPLINDSVIDNADLAALRERNTNINLIDPTLPVVLTADQEAVNPEKTDGPPEYFVKNKSANVDHWVAMINSHVHWIQQNTSHPVIGVSPFNEPDYWTVEEGATIEKHAQVGRILKEQYPRFADIVIVGGNTLNNDKALEWFNGGKDLYEWGNTHQLAGSFDNYANYYQQLAAMGKTGYNDELHNVGEAFIGLEYGMTVGIWWGFDSRARGEFCDISRHGQRLAYGEHRGNWTAAAVYRHDDGRVKAFVGSSERQATTTAFQLLSPTRSLYFDGYGPMREYTTVMPGGSGYQVGQTNAERVIDITWGEDVPPCPIVKGKYKIVNKVTGNVVSVNNRSITQQAYTGAATQQWTIAPATTRTGGDLSFYDIESVSNAKTRINVKDFSVNNGAELLAYSENEVPSSNEQWYLQYAGDGYYFIRNRESSLYLTSAGASTQNNVRVIQGTLYNETLQQRQMWRILPVDVDYETNAPAQPAGLIAEAQPASVRLTWDANTESDLDGYMVLRSENGSDEWNTIARRVKDHFFVDNDCRQGATYIYKVKAIDLSQNMSEPSATAEGAVTGQHAMIARWHMDQDLYDITDNMMDAACGGTVTYMEDHKSGSHALRLSNATTGADNYVQLPYGVANSDELTVALWVNLRLNKAWQRIFDFGNDTGHYLFLTPTNGSVMRFAIKNGGSEQTVDAPILSSMTWKHVAVTIGKEKTVIYVDGQEVGSSTGITIRPSDICPALNYLGRSQYVADPNLSAFLDDMRIYNYALTADEVRAAMDDTTNAIDQMPSEQSPSSRAIYSIDGRRLPAPRKGIQIIDRRKIALE